MNNNLGSDILYAMGVKSISRQFFAYHCIIPQCLTTCTM